MKHLYLIRHAKSSWSNPALSDFERPLNKRGRRDAPVMGRRLASAAYQPECILSSPARRARKTARIIGAEMSLPKPDIIIDQALYTFTAEGVLDIIKKSQDSIKVLALVGHNHGITECAEYLSGEQLGNIPTCGIVLIEFSCDSWNGVHPDFGRLLFFDYPKLHETPGRNN